MEFSRLSRGPQKIGSFLARMMGLLGLEGLLVIDHHSPQISTGFCTLWEPRLAILLPIETCTW